MTEADELEARNRLVEDHADLAEHFARRYAGRGLARDDLRQMAMLAMVKAADRFEPDRGVAFSTFASRTIEGEMKRYFRDRTWSVRPPRRAQELHLELRKVDEELRELNKEQEKAMRDGVITAKESEKIMEERREYEKARADLESFRRSFSDYRS